ncbi:MAG: DUF1800 domain-containing protein, partial [Phycisphaerales bacterium]|nr:DUF1800 domain-containing protein [Phycisphaerales bacterium]
EFISVKLCRLFIHDNFVHGVYDYTDPNRSAEAELIRKCMVAWNTPVGGKKGNIRSILRTIFDSELFRSHGGSLQKVKTPLEFVISSIRAFRSENADGTATAGTGNSSFNTQLGRMGAMSLFNRSDPDGYPEAGPPWISAGTLAERLRFAQTLVMVTTGRGDDAGNATANPVALLQKKRPSAEWYDAGAVADFFLGLLYPAEGRANLDQYRAAAVRFLNTADDGVTPDLLRSGMAAATYDTRIRGMVAMLMTFQRFQEQ